ENIILSGFTVDGNARRLGQGATGSGGSRDSGITFRAVKGGTITRVKTKNTLLHGIDVTCGGLDYPYLGDGYVPPYPSQYVVISGCGTRGFGHDRYFTTQYENNNISNCYSHDARFRGNQNGIEIDDGSRHILLANNQTARNYAGIEIKAHDSASASQNIIING